MFVVWDISIQSAFGPFPSEDEAITWAKKFIWLKGFLVRSVQTPKEPH